MCNVAYKKIFNAWYLPTYPIEVAEKLRSDGKYLRYVRCNTVVNNKYMIYGECERTDEFLNCHK